MNIFEKYNKIHKDWCDISNLISELVSKYVESTIGFAGEAGDSNNVGKTNKSEFGWSILDNDTIQISYAVSFHKSQGLEYDSVKIVVTDDVQDSITHNILYTAATRAKKNLKIYWSPEVEQKVLSTIKPFDVSRDINIFKSLQELETNSFHRKR